MELAAEKMISANRAEYGDAYSRMSFVTPRAADENSDRRDLLLAELSRRAKVIHHETKLYTGELSPGCSTCGEGSWSCLFINGICNGRCFYCPTTQKSIGEPMTNNVRFASPRDYLDYIAHFGFRGVSLSGGEPFMTFDRTMTYVSKLKRRFGNAIHLWLYTNGILVTPDKIARLSDAGLDEIRFDISADCYSLDKLKMAVGKIPCITVEIPAIPEDYCKLRDMLPLLTDTGVNHLNLHQLRCTPHNLSHLLKRSYVFSHGPKVIVPESEITALKLLFDAGEKNGPPVNYCSYAYKYRFQARAARRRAAAILAASYEDVTEAGFIRSLELRGDRQTLCRCTERFEDAGVDYGLYRLDLHNRLLFNEALWPLVDFSGLELHASYYQAQLKESSSYRGSHMKIPLNRKRSLIAERVRVDGGGMITDGERQFFHSAFISGDDEPAAKASDEKKSKQFADIFEYERIPRGLLPYF